jgi:GxxExxY protein
MRELKPVPEQTERLGKTVVDAVFKVHKALGPGLLESVYETCLTHELSSRRVPVESQVFLPVVYRGVTLDAGLRLDLLVDRQIVVEVKAVERMNPVFKAQLMSYLKLAGLRLGFLVNFNVPLISQGINRIVV